MIQYFQNITSSSLTLNDFLFNIFVALICGLIHIAFYKKAYRGPGYSVGFLNSLVLLTMITALVIMVIGDSLARAFGLVGAMSIIRFRTAVKEVTDIVNIFFALAVGMAAGAGLYSAALIGTIILGFIYLSLVKFNIISSNHEQFVVQFSYLQKPSETNGKEPPYLSKLTNYCKSNTLINVKTLSNINELEISYYVKPKNKNGIVQLIRELKSIEGINSVTAFSNEEQF